MRFSEAVDLFLAEKKMSGYTQSTLKFYENTTGQLIKYSPNGTVAELQSAVDHLFLNLSQRDISPATLHSYWRGTKTFCRWAHSAQYCEPIRLPKVKKPQLTIRPMTTEQVKTILGHFSDDSWMSIRNRAIIFLLWDTGLRVSELCSLTEDTVNWDDRWVLVRGKGNKERFVPFGRKSRQHLWEYWKRRAQFASPRQRHVFISKLDKALDRRAIQMVFRRLQEAYHFPGVRLSAHTLRHTFAVHYIEAGGDPFTLQRILGHADQQMTSRYLNVSKVHLIDAHHHFAPGDRG